MKKIEAIIQQDMLEELKDAIDREVEISGMTVMQVLGCGKQKGLKEYVRGQEVITTLLPKVMVSFIVKDEQVEDIIARILDICQTEEVGDGKIFVYPIEEAVRIRTRERGTQAI
ncbi:P-II family nitrogen regulator [Candidatus Enterococcus clewellii]|uniref:Nitrogen regulatory protein P-II 1 n=1 Tax=Candidatus Enterococcus clewellii TaxID=1834193 RepID=A0A242K5Q5_9ENTE|nr:P-II family nitrogen regulator [Enterococcus sp. 9E7_DIV0242]OTP15648.1 hypothetical protein A5888_001862 [Enterococcus sp. 9E7_DIV0242]